MRICEECGNDECAYGMLVCLECAEILTEVIYYDAELTEKGY